MTKRYLITLEDTEDIILGEQKNKKNIIQSNNTIKQKECQENNKGRIDFYVPIEVKERLKHISKVNG